MHRKNLLEKLKKFDPGTIQDLGVIEKFRNFVIENEKCFERSFDEGHVTGSAWLLDSTGQRVLLTHHKKLNRWMQLGGHSDGDADSLEVALKEAREESGIDNIKAISKEIFDLDIHVIPATEKEPEHTHYDVRYLLQAENDDYTVSEESHDLRWMNVEEIEELRLEPSVMKMVKKWGQVRNRI